LAINSLFYLTRRLLMEKVVLIVDGFSEGKNIFQKVLKENNYWVWNINNMNVLSIVPPKILLYKGERNEKFYSFIGEFKDLADKYFDFERAYTLSMIDKFMEDERADVLIIHNCEGKLAMELQEFYSNCFDVYIGENDEESVTYCKTLNYMSEDYKENILKVMRILTKPFSEGE